MKTKYWLVAVAVLTFGSHTVLAQAPTGSTGQCKDGTYTNAVKKSGACSGHKGVQTWFSASASPAGSTSQTAGQEPTPASLPASPKSSAATPAPAQPAPAPAPAPTAMSRSQSPGGGPGMVWVNTSTKVYHCYGTRYYGTTKNGKYMSEADAASMGARADHNTPCPK